MTRSGVLSRSGLLIGAAAALLHFWGLTRLGLTHFDEGSYALAARWIASLGAQGHPVEPVHAPPLYPLLAALAFRIFGVQDWAAIGVSAAAGVATVLVVLRLGRRWFGEDVGRLAALLYASSAYAWFYSRMALTDALFCLLFWTALLLIDRALQEGGARRLLAAGLAVGLCWNTKYHGFLPLLVSALWVLLGAARRGDGRVWRRWGAVAAVAVAGILPWALTLAWTGKVAETAASLWTHSVGEAGADRRFSLLAMWTYASSWTSPMLVVIAAVTAVMASLTQKGLPVRRLVIVAALWPLLALTYRSFPRLLLPWIPALCLLTAVALRQLSCRLPERWRRPGRLAAAALLLTLNLAQLWSYLGLHTDGYRRAAAFVHQLQRPVLSQCSKNYYFYEDEPSQQLRLLSLSQLEERLTATPDLLIVSDPILQRFPEKRRWFEGLGARRRALGRFEFGYYPPVRYQGFNPEDTTEAADAPLLHAEPVIEVWGVERGSGPVEGEPAPVR